MTLLASLSLPLNSAFEYVVFYAALISIWTVSMAWSVQTYRESSSK